MKKKKKRTSWKPTWQEFDRKYMQFYFGGKHNPRENRGGRPHSGQVAPEAEMTTLHGETPREEKHASGPDMGFKEGQYCYAPWSDGNFYLAHIGAQLEQEEKEGDDPTYEVEFEEKNEGGVVYRSQMRLDKPEY